MLAPNLRQVAGSILGWPLLAVAPNRDFLYLWSDEHEGFASRLGGVVVDQFAKASYPISTEVYHITEGKIEVIGEFPRQ